MKKRADHKIVLISVGIPVFNEEKNIANLLNGILNQRGENFEIGEIIVANDGSTDNTEQIVKDFVDKRIKIISDEKRLGKPLRVNQMFESFIGDVLILHDGDVLLSDDAVYEKLVDGFNRSSASLVIASAQAIPGSSLIGRAIDNFYEARESFISEFDYKKTIYGARAGGFLLSKDFAKEINFFKELLNDDTHLYLYCKLKGLKVHFQEDAVIWFRAAQTAADFRKQTIRYIRGGIQINNIFGNELLDRENFMPEGLLVKIMWFQVFKDPLAYICLKMNSIYCKFFVMLNGSTQSSIWSCADSSKELGSIQRHSSMGWLGGLVRGIKIGFDLISGLSVKRN